MGFADLLHRLRAAADRDLRGGDLPDLDFCGLGLGELKDEIEHLAEFEPEASRAEALAYTGDELMRIWALGLIGDPRDLDRIVAALDDPGLRFTALEAVGGQRDRDVIDPIARGYLTDPDPDVRAKAVSLVAWLRRPGYVDALMPLTRDPDENVRSIITLRLAIRAEPAAEPLLRVMVDDPVDRIRRSAQRGLEHLTGRPR
jgi:HEAT repeat protein